MRNIRQVVVGVSVVSVVLVGCAAEADDVEEGEVTGETAQALQGGTCPVGATHAEKVSLETKVSRAFAYVVGGPSPFDAYPCEGPSLAESCLTGLRHSLADGACDLGPARPKRVCGLRSSERLLDCDESADPSWSGLAACGEELDRCWGTGASGFFYSRQTRRGGYIDPEPARLTQSLSGSTGATAAAIYTISLAPTQVIKWPSTPGAGSAPAGTPCTTGDASINTETTHVIQVLSNGYKRCL